MKHRRPTPPGLDDRAADHPSQAHHVHLPWLTCPRCMARSYSLWGAKHRPEAGKYGREEDR